MLALSRFHAGTFFCYGAGVLALIACTAFAAHAEFTTLRSFGFADHSTGGGPETALLRGRDGTYYGTTCYGGISNLGTIFKVNPDGSGFATIYSFTNYGWPPYGGTMPYNSQLPLVEGPDEALFGASTSGNYIYRLNKDGSGFTVLRRLNTMPGSILAPESLLLGSDGALYGTCLGGTNNLGAIFRLTLDGSNGIVLHHFAGGDDDGSNPTGALVEDADGVLYGVTVEGNNAACPQCSGILYKINKDGSGYTKLHQFVVSAPEKAPPKDGLLLGSDGRLYGVTAYGSQTNQGTIYAIDRTGQNLSVLYEFMGGTNGLDPLGPLSEGPDGALYGLVYMLTNNVLYTHIFRINRNGTGYTNLYAFAANDGTRHAISILDGSIVGTSTGGGQHGDGYAFRLNLDGTGFESLVQFNSRAGDGSWPTHLISSLDGWLYGVTGVGGNHGHGTVFKIQPNGSNYTRLFHFAGTNGTWPDRLVDGWPAPCLYGTTREGGSTDGGVIFKVSKDGADFQLLHDFDWTKGDGRNPVPVLFQSSYGTLYGATDAGGPSGFGFIFRMQTNGENYQILHNFQYNSYEGAHLSSLIEDPRGTLYFSTLNWSYTDGAIIKMNTDGTGFDVLTSFSGGVFSGYDAPRSLEYGGDGLLHFTLQGRGMSQGYLCVMNSTNTWPAPYTVLHSFRQTEGSVSTTSACLQTGGDWIIGIAQGFHLNPGTIFAQSRDGRHFALPHVFTNAPFLSPTSLCPGPPVAGGGLYGVTGSGGAQNFGTIFRLHPPPIVATNSDAVFAKPGDLATLTTPVSGSGPVDLQWQFNGADIPGPTGGKKDFVVQPVTPETCGNYTLVMTNAFGCATSAPIALSMFTAQRVGTNMQLTLFGGPGIRYEFQTKRHIDNFYNCSILVSFRLSSNSFTWTDPISFSTNQFYYRAMFWGR